ncbi:MAG TPA: hypothetical protein VGF49_05765 [Candidatus Solibacter sp.]
MRRLYGWARRHSRRTRRDQIQMHLGHIAGMFAKGNFQAPVLVHDKAPPGVSVLEELKEQVRYPFTKTERGGTVWRHWPRQPGLAAPHCGEPQTEIESHDYRPLPDGRGSDWAMRGRGSLRSLTVAARYGRRKLRGLQQTNAQ